MALLTGIFLLLSAAERTGAQGYMDHCPYGAYVDHGEAKDQFQAVCYARRTMRVVDTDINLNRCLINNGGVLTWQRNGGAFASCISCASKMGSANILQCYCRERNHAYMFTQINLNDGLKVTDDGAIACFDNIGDVSDAAGIEKTS